MDDIIIRPYNATYNKIIIEDRGIEQELWDYFTFRVPNADWMKRRNPKLKWWDGNVRLFNKKTKQIYTGLASRVESFAKDRDFTVENQLAGATNFSAHEANEFIKTLNLPETLVPRYYQYKSFLHSVRYRRGLILSPTSSGKSLFLYILIQYYLQNNFKILLIVPTLNLIHQMYTDFESYGWDVEKHIHLIFEGQKKTSDKPLYISTWQSIYDMPEKYFNFDAILVDEAHHAQADSIKGVMEKSKDTILRIGCTGTLNDTATHRLVLEGLFGPVYQAITTKELMNQGYASKLKIKCIVLKHSPMTCRAAASFDYNEEIEFLSTFEKRNNYIKNLALSLDNNVLILFRLVDKHGKILYNLIKESTTRPVFYIHGGVEGEERERIRQILLKEENAILIGSYGTVSTGINWPSLKSIIAAAPYKSRIKVLQSIGRGLRKSEDKFECTWFDIADDLTYKNKQNTTLEHFNERVRIYYEEEFAPKIYKVEL